MTAAWADCRAADMRSARSAGSEVPVRYLPSVLLAVALAGCRAYVSGVSAGDATGRDTPASDASADGPLPVPALAERVRRALCPTQRPGYYAIEYVDARPSVSVEGREGHRTVLSVQFVKYLPDSHPRAMQARSPQGPDAGTVHAPPAVNVKEFVELVVFPLGDRDCHGFAGLVPWSGFTSMYHLQSVDMGTGLGYHWFGRMHLWEQDCLRERLGLTGGDDRLELARQGLAVKDQGGMTANSMRALLRRFEERAQSDH